MITNNFRFTNYVAVGEWTEVKRSLEKFKETLTNYNNVIGVLFDRTNILLRGDNENGSMLFQR